MVFWQKPPCNTTLHKIHDLRSASPLGAFRGKGKWLEQGFVLQKEKKKEKKKILPAELSACCFLPSAKDEMFVSRHVCWNLSQEEMSQLLQRAGLGRAGQEEAVGTPGCCLVHLYRA